MNADGDEGFSWHKRDGSQVIDAKGWQDVSTYSGFPGLTHYAEAVGLCRSDTCRDFELYPAFADQARQH